MGKRQSMTIPGITHGAICYLCLIADGHKMVLVEGIPTVFSWDSIQQFDGKLENNYAEGISVVHSETCLLFTVKLFTIYFPRS
jgi:hypothetical protein